MKIGEKEIVFDTSCTSASCCEKNCLSPCSSLLEIEDEMKRFADLDPLQFQSESIISVTESLSLLIEN